MTNDPRWPKLILASQSQRRRELLENAKFEFAVIAPPESIEAECPDSGDPRSLVTELASRKATYVAGLVDAGIILAADTIAECGGSILGKPVDRQHAQKMLQLLSGQPHRVLTGVCLVHRPSNRKLIRCEETVLQMDRLTERQLLQYLQSDAWIGKAGAFGYQDGLDWVHVVQGSQSNVVGLPMEKLGGWIDELLSLLCNQRIH